MDTVMHFLVWYLGWFVLGCVVMNAIDDDQRRLFKWANEAPFFLGFELVVTLWPVFLYIVLMRKRRG